MPAAAAKTERRPPDAFDLRGPPDDLVGVVKVSRPALSSPGLATLRPMAPAADRRRLIPGAPHGQRFAPAELPKREGPNGADAGAPPSLIRSTLPKGGAAPRALRIGAVAPGETRMAPVRLKLDPRTPPGVYEATFSIGGAAREARIEVLPRQGLSIIPASIDLTGRPGAAVIETLVLENIGNAPLELGALGVMVTEAMDQICLSLQQAMTETGQRGQAGFVDAFFSSLAERKTDVVRAAVASGRVTLAPGEARSVPVVFHLPRNMKPGQRYTALLKCLTAQVSAQISATGPEGARATIAKGKP